MKSQTVITLWVVAAILGIIACIVQFGGSDDATTRTKLSPGDKILPGLPIREITEVHLSRGEQSTQMVRLNNGEWAITQRANYPPDYEQLRNLLGALNELEATQGYPASEQHFGRFGLQQNSEEPSERALRVVMKKSDGSVAADVFLGKISGNNRAGGRFLRVASDDSGVYKVGEIFPGITASPGQWLGKDFLRIEKIKSIELKAPADPGFNSWKLIRHPNTDGTVNENGQLKLADLSDKETMQLTSTGQLRNLFGYTTFIDILSGQQARQTANPDAKLKRQAIITTYDDITYTVTFWPQLEPAKDPTADPRMPAPKPDYFMTVTTSAKLQPKRTPAKDETPEDTKKKDAEHAARQQAIKAKLTATRTFHDRIFLVSHATIAPLQKSRTDFAKAITPKPTAVTSPIPFPDNPPSTPTPNKPQ